MLVIRRHVILIAMLVAVVCLVVGVPSAQAQPCEPQWRPFDEASAAYRGVFGSVYASTMWDPDGPGPLSSRLVVGGNFNIAGDVFASNIAAYDYDTQSWSALGAGTNNSIYVLATDHEGNLLAGGDFWMAGGVPAGRIARWNHAASTWSPVGGNGTTGTINAIIPLSDGDIIIAGAFQLAGATQANRIAKLDHATGTWSAFGSGLEGGATPTVLALAMLGNGDIVAAGRFTTAGGNPASHIARWSITQGTWTSLGSGITGVFSPYATVNVGALVVDSAGDLVAGGFFETAGGVPAKHVARWHDATQTWSPLGIGLGSGDKENSGVRALTMLANGDLLAAGRFTNTGYQSLKRWDGSDWTPILPATSGSNGSFNLTILGLSSGDIITGGSFEWAGSTYATNVAQWSASTGEWSAFGTSVGGFLPQVSAVAAMTNGDVLVGGRIAALAGLNANNIVRWNEASGSWSTLGTGIGGTTPLVMKIVALPGGSDAIVAGDFETAGDIVVNNIARWQDLGGGAGQWSGFGVGTNGAVVEVLLLDDGDFIAGGGFTISGSVFINHIGRWNQATQAWSPLGTGMNAGVSALALLPDGDLLAGGSFTTAGGVPAKCIARWNVATGTWAAVGTGMAGGVGTPNVRDITVLPNGDFFATGTFITAGGVTVNHIARWTESTGKWSALGAGLTGTGLPSGRAFAMLPTEDLIVTGNFASAGGLVANDIARWDDAAQSWSPLGQGLFTKVTGASNGAWGYALSTLPSGELLVGGDFLMAGDVVAPYIARYGCPKPACYADCDQSGSLDINDFVCFQTFFALGDPSTDCDASGSLDIDDFICFQTAFALGC